VDLWNESVALDLVHSSLVEALGQVAKVPATPWKLSQVPLTAASALRQLARVPESEAVPLTLGEHLHKAQQLSRPPRLENAAVPLRCKRKRTETHCHLRQQGGQPLWAFSLASELLRQDLEGLLQSKEAPLPQELAPKSLPRAESLMAMVAQKKLMLQQSWAAQQLLHCLLLLLLLPPLLGWPGLAALRRVLDVPLQAPGFVLAGLR
jgi:hypothetical protein